MTSFTDSEVINDWLTLIDDTLVYETDHELWQNRKTLILDSIEVLNHIRKETSDLDIRDDNRIQSLLDLCSLPCRNDYYQRFLRFDSRYYRNENDWWVDCWQTIRMKNILHKLGFIDINSYLEGVSDGIEFAEKWPKFYMNSKIQKAKKSLAAFSYLECIRFLLNMGNGKLEVKHYLELKQFLEKLGEYDGNGLKYFKSSNEMRANSLDVIDCIKDSSQRDGLNDVHGNIGDTLKKMIVSTKWDQYSHTWATFFLYGLNNDVSSITKSKIPDNFLVNKAWISSYNHTRKPRYALLAVIDKLDNSHFFNLIKPNPIAYTPNYKFEKYAKLIKILDNAVQSFKEIKDIQRIAQENKIKEEYFRDLIKATISANLDDVIKYAEKEANLSSGRITDILLVREKDFNIPIEIKILWRFKSDAYEPINEILEQMTDGTFGIVIVINPPNNPKYSGAYQGFEGWKCYVKDHSTYINETIREADDYYGRLKTKSVYSEHASSISGRNRTITILSMVIDLTEYIRPAHLRKLG